MFNFLAPPRPFVPVPARRSRRYFMRRPESRLPLDSE